MVCFGLTLMSRGSFVQLVLFQAPLHQRQGKGGAIDRNIDFGKEVGHGADVVFMTVRKDQGPDLVLVFLEEGEVGHHQVDTQEFGVRKHHAGIDNDDVVAIADDGHVHAEFAEAAERDHLQLLISHSVSLSTITCCLKFEKL